MSPKLKMHGPLCNQTVNLKTDSKTLYYSILKLKHNEGYKKYALFNNSHNNCHSNYTYRIFLQKHVFRSIDLCMVRDMCRELFCVFGDFYVSGTWVAEVTKSLGLKCLESNSKRVKEK